jgi:CubicO group peptidase (beta-lactamase class C family)
MKRTFPSAALVCLVLLLAAARAEPLPRIEPREAGFSAEKLARIEALLSDAVDQRLVAGGAALVARRGRVAYVATFRIASMTKPITSVAAMMLVEDGKLRLDDPVAKYIPEFGAVRVLASDAAPNTPGSPSTSGLRPDARLTVHHLLTHTSGITYSLFNRPVLGELYRQLGVSDVLIETPGTMADNVRKLAAAPLLHQPGAAWEYGLNTDVLGRVIEVVSGQTLDEFFRVRIFKPLAMHDTHFLVPPEKRPRLAALYAPDENKKIRLVGKGPQQIGTVRYSATYAAWDEGRYFSGGAGLSSTLGDYWRFLQMLANRGELDGVRLLKPETADRMTSNQIGELLPWIGGHGDKFGYGFGVVTEAGRGKDVASVGSYSWGGIFHTYFLVDPREQLVAILMTQIYPFDHLTLRDDFKRCVYEALEVRSE